MTERGFPARLAERVEDRLERLVERAGMTYRGFETAPDTTLGATPYANMDTTGSDGRDDGDLRIFPTEMPGCADVRWSSLNPTPSSTPSWCPRLHSARGRPVH